LPQASLALALFCLAGTTAPPSSSEPVSLELARLYVASEGGARVAPEVEALHGRRVRALGFMARMEEAPKGAFYLTRYPVEAEEGGAGTGDLPPGALRVEIPRLRGEEVAWVPGVVEAVGSLEVGRAEDSEGRVSWLRLVVDAPPPAAPDPSASVRSRTDSPAATKRRGTP
jgi:hypothetical protein